MSLKESEDYTPVVIRITVPNSDYLEYCSKVNIENMETWKLAKNRKSMQQQMHL